MAKTVFEDGNPSLGILGTIVNAVFLNKIFAHRHDGADADGSAPLNYAADTGAADAYAIALTPALTAHVAGLPIVFKATNANTGASTVTINALAAVAIKDATGADLAANAIAAGGLVIVVYDGTNYQLISLGGRTALPAGTLVDWPTETIPSGLRLLERNGASLVRSTYAELFAVIGTIYGAADGTHFNLPDDRGLFTRYWAHGTTIDPDKATRTAPTAPGATCVAGDHVGTEQVDDLESHSHFEQFWNTSSGGSGTGAASVTSTGANLTTSNESTVGVATKTGGSRTESRPKNRYCMPLISY